MEQEKMMAEPIWHEEAAKQLLHILPQITYHDHATICGAPDALRKLGEALIRAADTGKDVSLTEVMARDGEGYHVSIKPRDQWQMEAFPMPYAQLGHPWDFDPAPRGAEKETRDD